MHISYSYMLSIVLTLTDTGTSFYKSTSPAHNRFVNGIEAA